MRDGENGNDVYLLHAYDLDASRLASLRAELGRHGLTKVFHDGATTMPTSTSRLMIAMDSCKCVLVLVTPRLVECVKSLDHGQNGVQKQFVYAMLRKSSKNIFAARMSHDCPPQSEWSGLLGQTLGPRHDLLDFTDEASIVDNAATAARAVLDRVNHVPHTLALRSKLQHVPNKMEMVRDQLETHERNLQHLSSSLEAPPATSPARSSIVIDAPPPLPAAHEQYMGFLRGVPVLQKCTEAELRLLAEQVIVCDFSGGETVFRQGDAGDLFYFVLAGQASVCVADRVTARAKEVATLAQGAYFGEKALLMADRPRAATVTALGPLRVLALDRETFSRVLVDTKEQRSLRARCDGLSRRIKQGPLGELSELSELS